MTVLDYTQRAARARTLLADEVLTETFDRVRDRQVQKFLSGVTGEELTKAQAIVAALDLILTELHSDVADEAFQDRRKGSTA